MTVPTTARAAVLAKYHEPFEVRELPLPSPEPGAILVKNECATVCGSDVHIWEGGLEGAAIPIPPPLILGHETVGRIVEFGDGPRTDSAGAPLAIGDRVVWTHESCGHCDMCSVHGHPEMCRGGRGELCRTHRRQRGGAGRDDQLPARRRDPGRRATGAAGHGHDQQTRTEAAHCGRCAGPAA